MNPSYLSIGRLERQLSNGKKEYLEFFPGVNVFVGPPNTGKSVWLQTLDYLLGDAGKNPFEDAEEGGLSEKYDAAGVELKIGEEQFWIERKWREPGAKTKIFVDDKRIPTDEFQRFLMLKLGIPMLKFPKGNPMSGQTWSTLSFRMLLRHIYRQQKFWLGIADQQPEGEMHACLLQFVGLAERIYSDEYGKLIKRKMEVEQLRARRSQYKETLNELAREVLSETGLSTGVNVKTVSEAEKRLKLKIESLRKSRLELIANARDQKISFEQRSRVMQLSEERAALLVAHEELRYRAKATSERLDEMNRYHTDLSDELDRMTRGEEAGAVLADLKVTHCPACDQPVDNKVADNEYCFLCHKALSDEPLIEELGAVRIKFESVRLAGELKEAEELLDVLKREAKRIEKEIALTMERLLMIENSLSPSRQAIAGLAQEEVSAIDMALGELNERQRQLGRISDALELGQKLTGKISDLEKKIEPLQEHVDELVRGTDFEAAAAKLEDGMNTYLSAIDVLRPGAWRCSSVKVNISRSRITMRVGDRRWQTALGGTTTLYFLMAYHYGLLTLSDKPDCHYPGLSVIDMPGEFSGEAIEDKENFIVQPFIDLLSGKQYDGVQVIMTGASFAGLKHVHRRRLTNIYVA